MMESTSPAEEKIIKNINLIENQLQKTVSSVIGSLETLGDMLHYDDDLAEIDYFINSLEAYLKRLKEEKAEVQQFIENDATEPDYYHYIPYYYHYRPTPGDGEVS